MKEKSLTRKKIYQIAKEINISHQTLIVYLKKKGHVVKSHMSIVDETMLHDIMSHFKKDKDVAEKHQRKIQSLRETRQKSETKPSIEVAPQKVKEDRKSVTKQPVKEFEQGQSVVVKESHKKRPEQLIEVPEKPIEEKKIPHPEETPKQPSTKPEVRQPPVVKQAPKQPKMKSGKEKERGGVIERKIPKMGLTIKGKIDLDKVNKSSAIPEETTPEIVVPPAIPEEGKKKRKKKKKRIRIEAREEQFDEQAEFLRKARRKKKLRYREVDQEEVEEAIKKTLAAMDDTRTVTHKPNFKRKRKEKRLIEEQLHLQELEKEKTIFRVTEFLTVHELANLIGVNVSEVIKKCIELGLMVSINQRLDKDTIALVADEFGFQVDFFSGLEEDIIEEENQDGGLLESRPPVVTIMGHVDHGKTSLLDYIRRSNIVGGEAGGITQHIGAYMVSTDNQKSITFLDTPGHEAFTAMRARGAQLTDIVILVVAADDNVMPQTVEAISHAQAANVPIIIAINKIDKPEANPDRIRQQLSEKNVLVEEWGGKYQCVELSARTGKNVNLLLEKILLEAELLDLKANPHQRAWGIVLEAKVDKGKGVVATILVQKGTLKIGDSFIAGIQSGKVRAIYDERGNRLEIVKPSTPAQVLGFDRIPQAGDKFFVVDNEREARAIGLRRQQLKREQDLRLVQSVTLDDISNKIKEGQVKELKVIVKGDVDGSVGALADSLMKITHEEVRVNVIHHAVGSISESDVLLAAASNAVIIGFHVRPNLNARKLAEQENVDIRLYNIIYDATGDIKKALEGLLTPERKEEVTATVEVREIFKVPKVGTIAGCYVQDGKLVRNNRVRLIRDGTSIFEGGIASLKRFKDDVREVEAGYECGIGLENYDDLKVGDIIEAFKIVETVRKLT